MEEDNKEEVVVDEQHTQQEEPQQEQAQTTQDLTQVLANQDAIMLAIQNLATLVLNNTNKKEGEIKQDGNTYTI